MTNTTYLVTDSHGNRRAPVTRKELASDYLTVYGMAKFDAWVEAGAEGSLDLSDGPSLLLLIERAPD